jgi:hypothetical protein
MSHGKTFLLRVSAPDLGWESLRNPREQQLTMVFPESRPSARALTIILHLPAVSKGFSAKRLLSVPLDLEPPHSGLELLIASCQRI